MCVRVARTWFVHLDPVAQDGDGESWLTAALHPQDVMDKAGDGDQIWVAAGTYAVRSPGDTVLLEMVPGVSVYGGFVGDETRLDQRDVRNRRPIFDCAGRCRQVVYGATRATLDGVVVRGAAAAGSDSPADGSGLYAVDVGGLRVRDCVFIANAGVHGAGVTIERPVGPVEIVDCLFESNLGDQNGGGLHVSACDGGRVSLERGEFRWPRSNHTAVEISADQLLRLLSGFDVSVSRVA